MNFCSYRLTIHYGWVCKVRRRFQSISLVIFDDLYRLQKKGNLYKTTPKSGPIHDLTSFCTFLVEKELSWNLNPKTNLMLYQLIQLSNMLKKSKAFSFLLNSVAAKIPVYRWNPYKLQMKENLYFSSVYPIKILEIDLSNGVWIFCWNT